MWCRLSVSGFSLVITIPLAGMLDLKGAHEWVVTTKLGSSDVRPGTTPVMTSSRK